MLYGLSLSAAGGQLERVRLENVSNNMANVNTVGFKQEVLSIMQRPVESKTWLTPKQTERALYQHSLLDAIGGGVWLHRSYTDHSTGNIRPTYNDYDFAIETKGPAGAFFTLKEDQSDEVRYSRAGNFKVSSDGVLMTADGEHNVLDTGMNTINIGDLIRENGGGKLSADENGKLYIVNDNDTVDTGVQLAITIFNEEDTGLLDKHGNNMFAAMEEGLADRGTLLSDIDAEKRRSAAHIHHGFLEMSGADAVDQMVKMVDVQRAYQMNMNLMNVQNSTLENLISEVARPG